MELKIKKISPLVILTIVCLAVGGAIAAMYWSSDPLTHTVTVTGWLTATTNFDVDDLVGITSFAALDALGTNALIKENGNFMVRVAVEDTNAQDCYATLDMTLPSGVTATADYGRFIYENGLEIGGLMIGPITIGESFQVYDSVPTWLYQSDYAIGSIRVLVFEITLSGMGGISTLGPGDYVISAIVSLGDNLPG